MNGTALAAILLGLVGRCAGCGVAGCSLCHFDAWSKGERRIRKIRHNYSRLAPQGDARLGQFRANRSVLSDRWAFNHWAKFATNSIGIRCKYDLAASRQGLPAPPTPRESGWG